MITIFTKPKGMFVRFGRFLTPCLEKSFSKDLDINKCRTYDKYAYTVWEKKNLQWVPVDTMYSPTVMENEK